MATNVNKRNSLPSLTLNKYFVSKRTSMFECQEENPREKREKSPCGMLEVSEKKLQARKDTKKKVDDIAKRKRLANPYAEESTDMDADEQEIAQKPEVTERKNKNVNGIEELKPCPHTNKAVNKERVRKFLKVGETPYGQCTQCKRAVSPLGFLSENGIDPKESYVPVIWLCAFCGNQGCDRKLHKHSFQHYNTPRSDDHFIAISTQTFTVWCYQCDNEVNPSSCKKLDELIQFIKSKSEMAGSRRRNSNRLTPQKPYTNLTSQLSGSDSRLYLSVQKEENQRERRLSKISASLDSIPRPKGLANLGNTCFFNSVMQSLSQTHFITRKFDLNLQENEKVVLPGYCRPTFESSSIFSYYSDFKEEELRPLEIYLPDGGALSKSFAKFLKEMHSVSNNSNVRPDQLFNAICNNHSVYSRRDQQDAHELLRNFLDSIRNEEIIRSRNAILKAYSLNKKTNPGTLNEKLKATIKAYGKQATQTIIDDIYGGQFISTVICEQCHSSSQVFEPFMDLSLPINEEKGKHRKGGDDDGLAECFGRTPRQDGPPKYQQKKTKKQQQRKKGKGKGRANNAKQLQHEEKLSRRLTEKRCPGDIDIFETTDADVEDNTDSDFGKKTRRQPSIVVDESVENTMNGNIEPEPQLDNRFLSSCQSLDHLNTASDTSERYYTAAGGETMDELDINFNEADAAVDGRYSIESKSPSMGTINSSSGKGDSISISSGETLEDKDFTLSVDQDHIDSICGKTSKLTIGMKAESNDSLLEASKSDIKKSTETLITFDLEDEDEKPLDMEEIKNKWSGESLKTLAPRYESDREECSVMSCLANFTAPELLTGCNKIECNKCTKLQTEIDCEGNEEMKPVKSSASKQLLIFSPPGVLTLHFKRFQQCGYNLRKINKYIQFPLVIDLAPFVSSGSQYLDNMVMGQRQVLYALYGIVEHSGNMTGGHYVSYVRTRPLEPSRVMKKFMNCKPSSLFQLDTLITEMAEKSQNRKSTPNKSMDINRVIEEVEQGRWYYISDSYVKEVNIEKVKKAQAYLLFYERVL